MIYNAKKIKIDLTNSILAETFLNIKSTRIINVSKKICEILGLSNIEINFYFCDKKEIKKLNIKYRRRYYIADVLSFRINEYSPETKLTVLGALALAPEKIKENADKIKRSYAAEFFHLVIHGLMHLNGMTHNSDKKLAAVNAKTIEILNQLKIK